jgi:peptidoglycan hydrolase CwlO-like protein
MSEILLQTLVEKVTEIDKLTKDTHERIGLLPDYSNQIDQVNKQMEILQAEVWAIPAQVSIPEANIVELKRLLHQNTEQLKRPLQQVIRHVHHLRWPVITCFIMGGVTLSLVVFLCLAWDKIHDNQASDIKYRDLRLWGTEPLQKILDARDSAYLVDPDGMEKLVTQEEQRRHQVREVQEQLEENQKEIRELDVMFQQM